MDSIEDTREHAITTLVDDGYTIDEARELVDDVIPAPEKTDA